MWSAGAQQRIRKYLGTFTHHWARVLVAKPRSPSLRELRFPLDELTPVRPQV